MKLKRTMMIATMLFFVGASLINVNASAKATAVPVLISIQQEEVRGNYVNYEEGLLTVTIDGAAATVAVMHDGEVEQVKEVSEMTYGAQFAILQPGTLIDMNVTMGDETTYMLESLVAIHQKFFGEGPVPILITEPVLYNQAFYGFDITFKDEVITMDTKPLVINDRVMIPLRFVAETLGYTVTWNSDTQSVDLMNGPQFTSVYIGQNSYFKNKMAPSELSAAPTIVDNRTLVPVEFINEILGYGIEFKDGAMKIYDEPMTTLTGYISKITELDNYDMVYVAPRLGDDVEMWEQTVLIVSENTIINRAPLAVGNLINGVHMPVMTMSIPGQTEAVIIY